jgi:hypothetical protein
MKKVVIKEEELKQLEAYLVELPYKYAQPILNLLSQNVVEDELPTSEDSEL